MDYCCYGPTINLLYLKRLRRDGWQRAIARAKFTCGSQAKAAAWDPERLTQAQLPEEEEVEVP